MRPIGHRSRTLATTEKNLATTYKEFLADVCVLSLLRPYLEGSHFTVRIDHEAQKRLLTMPEATIELAR